MEKQIHVIKRSGEKEIFNIDKINKTVIWATEGIKDVNLSDIEINAKINIRDGITTEEIHQVLIESAANLITIDTPNYQLVAARLLTYQIRKNVWGGKNPPKLIDLLKKNIAAGVYSSEILDWYSEKELNKIDEFIDHDRDFIFTYAGIKQLIDKYLTQNRKTKEIYETPQFAYILIAAFCFAKYPKATRLDYLKRAYNSYSKHKINLPTPIMAGVRSPLKSFASCLLTAVDDSMDSILANVSVIGHATAKRYGIGLSVAHIRALGSPIRGGDVVHTGKIPFLKVFESTVKSCHQNGIRGGSATTTTFVFDYDIQDILVLKNNAGTEENRVRKLDYSIGISKLFYQRWLDKKDITLFSSHECPDLYEKFGTPEFDGLYEKYEKDSSLKFKRTVSARDLFDLITKERIETGRIYILNIDNVNSHSAWLDTVQMSNLCVTGDTLIDIQADGQNLTVQMKDLDFYVKTGKELKVKSFDINTNEVVYSDITAFAQTGESIELIEIEDEQGNVVKCTPDHLIYTTNRGYVRAGDLNERDTLKIT
jgi:ribonucleoside-diphosphate reductase alpha chain